MSERDYTTREPHSAQAELRDQLQTLLAVCAENLRRASQAMFDLGQRNDALDWCAYPRCTNEATCSCDPCGAQVCKQHHRSLVYHGMDTGVCQMCDEKMDASLQESRERAAGCFDVAGPEGQIGEEECQ